jgi:hypothetical protein
LAFKKKKKNTCRRITLLFPIIPNGQHRGKNKNKMKNNKNLEEVFTLIKTQGIPALPF